MNARLRRPLGWALSTALTATVVMAGCGDDGGGQAAIDASTTTTTGTTTPSPTTPSATTAAPAATPVAIVDFDYEPATVEIALGQPITYACLFHSTMQGTITVGT